MKNIIAFALLALACGAPSEDREGTTWVDGMPDDPDSIDVPGQEGRADGSVWADGMFNAPEAKETFCAENPEAWFCSEIGTSEQAWTSAEYHGLAAGYGACYGPAQPAQGDCIFPRNRKFQVISNNIDCFAGAAPPAGPSTLQEQAIIDGFVNAAVSWHGTGGITVCKAGVGNCGVPQSDYVNVYINCEEVIPFNGAYAQGGLIGVVSTPVSNAPVGPHSNKDLDDFQLSDLGHIGINVQRIWDRGIKPCWTNPTATQIRGFTDWTGRHEMGHVLAFSHFGNTGTLMYAFRPGACLPTSLADQKYIDALNGFSPTGGSVTVNNYLLQNLLPQ